MRGTRSLTERFLRLFLRLYPRDFRSEYGEEWIEVARDRLTRMERDGRAFPRLRFLAFVLADLGSSIIRNPVSNRRAPVVPDGEKVPEGGRLTTRLDTLIQDLRFATRTLRRRPLFTFVAIGTLGLGIGATTAIYSVVDGVLLQPLPYDNPGTLLSVWQAYPGLRNADNPDRLWDRLQFTFRDYMEVRRGTTRFTDMAVFAGWGEMPLTGGGVPEQLSVGLGSANLFQVLGVRPALGRGFLPGEDASVPGEAALVAVLSHEIWERRFGSDPRILGETISLNATAYTVVGVLPPGFRLQSVMMTEWVGGEADRGLRDLWVPVGQKGTDLFDEGNAFEVLGRLAPGATITQAREETQALLAFDANNPDRQARAAPFKEVVTRDFGAPLYLILGAAALLLLIASANIATLLMGEATGRRSEMATRAALGAGKRRIVRQLLTESLLLGLLGSGLGILLAMLGTDVLVGFAPPIPRLEQVGVNWRVMSFGVGAGALTGILFGLAPLTLLLRDSLSTSLGGRSGGADRRGRTVQGTVVSFQIALTVVLLVAGSLLARSLANTLSTDSGFEPENLATLRISVAEGRYASQSDASLLIAEIVRGMESVPGVVSVGGSNGLPFPGGAPTNGFQIEGRGPEGQVVARRRTVLPQYHSTMGISLLDGRAFTADDVAGSPMAMIVSESMARRFWPTESPVGASVRFWGDGPWTIVGVVADVRHSTLSTEGEPTFYIPFTQVPRRDLNLVARTEGDPAQRLASLQEAIWSVDPEMPITEVSTMTELISRAGRDDRYRTVLILLFAVMAALLSAVGIFGVTARAVAQRTREMGIRMALGARAPSLVGDVLRRSFTLAASGTLVGLLSAWWASRLMSYFLFGIDARDPLTYGAVASLLFCVCLCASLVPAVRAARVAPMRVLREE